MTPTTPTELYETARKARKADRKAYVAVSDGTNLVGVEATQLATVLAELTGSTRNHFTDTRFYGTSWGNNSSRRVNTTKARPRAGLRVSTDYNRLIIAWNTGRLRLWLEPVPADVPVTVVSSLAIEPSTLRKAS